MGTFPHATPRVELMENFGTVLQCMDGRPQRKVSDYLTTSFGVRHIDTITTAGLVKHLVAETSQTPVLLENLAVSVEKHASHQIAVVAHADCAGNPISDKAQRQQVADAVKFVESRYPDAEVIGLWLNENWIVEKVAKS